MRQREAKPGNLLPDVRLQRALSCPSAALPSRVLRRLNSHHAGSSCTVALGRYRVMSRATMRVRRRLSVTSHCLPLDFHCIFTAFP